MNPGDLLMHLNPLLLLASLAAGALHLRDGDAEKRLLQRVSLGLLLGSLTASLLLLGSYFYRTALEFEYVADYSALELPLRYKLAGVWAGRDGTLLIWCWAAALALNWELWRGAMADGAGGARRRGDAHQHRVFVLFASGILLALAAIQLAINPFTLSDPLPTAGRGLNPLLQSPWMTIHPPIVFAAYGFAVPLYAAGLAALVARGDAWLDVGRRWARWFWLLTASALTMGGYWAYTTLGWGGFWAWDPVETSGLLPWLVGTTFLHTAVMGKRKRHYALLGPLLAMMVLLLVLFESFVTRGGIWLSVHAFLPSQGENAAQRFMSIIANDASVKGLVLLLSSCLVATGFVTARAYSRAPSPEPRQREKLEEWLDEDTTFFGAIYTQLLILTVTLVLLLMGVNGYLPSFVFESRLALFVALLAALFAIYTLQRWHPVRQLLGWCVAAAVASAILGLLLLGARPGSWMAGAALPWAALAGYAALRYLWSFRGKPLLPRLRAWGPYIAHLGIILVALGYGVSYGLDQVETIELEEGGSTEAAGFTVTLDDVAMRPGEENRLEAQFRLHRGERLVVDGTAARINTAGTAEWRTLIYLEHHLDRDIYVTLDEVWIDTEGDQPSRATLTVRQIPGIMLVWTGALLTTGGMALTMFTDWAPGKRWLRKVGN